MSPEQSESHPIRPEPSGELTALEKCDIEAFELIINILENHDPQLYRKLVEYQRIMDGQGQYFPEIVPYSSIGQELIEITHLLGSKECDTRHISLFTVLQSWLAWVAQQKISSRDDQIRVVKKLYVAIDKYAEPYKWEYITFKSIIEFIEDIRDKNDFSNSSDLAILAKELAELILEHQPEILVLADIVNRDQKTKFLNQVIRIWAEQVDTYIDQRARPIIAELDDSVLKGFSEKR